MVSGGMVRKGMLKFGAFELDAAAYELRVRGRAVRLERLPMELLLLLVDRRGHLVSREEIAGRLWGKDVFLDIDTAVNTAVRKLRQALKDSPDRSEYVQTVVGKGYRFVAPVSAGGDGQPPTLPRMTVAVLPFHNLTGDADQEYFSDGMTEETVAMLGKLSPQRLRVIARTSTMAYKRVRKTAGQIGQELGADYLLEGSVRREGPRVRITARLIRVVDQSQVWAAHYDRNADSLLGLQEELGKAIAAQVDIELSPSQSAALAARPTADPDAYDLYLRGRYYWNQFRYTALRRAIDYFEAAVARDPSFALAFAGLADTHSILPITSDRPPLEHWQEARRAADAAMRLGPNLAEGYAASGLAAFWLDWDWERAERDLRRAIELNPNYASAHRYYAHVLSNSGRHDDAAVESEKARQLDPLSPIMHAVSGQLLFQARCFGQAEACAKRALAIDSNFWIAHVVLAKVHERTGRLADALEEAQTALRLSEGNTEGLSQKGYVLAATGRRAEAEEVVGALAAIACGRYVPPYNVALVYAGLGDREAAFHWLEEARAARDVHMVFLTADAKWDSFRCDPRFRQLLERCGFGQIRDSDRLGGVI
jgi:TolB-like protein/Flp pilus assembly protein TadD